MENPCKTCFVQPCCSEPCREYGTYLYEIRQYEKAGKEVSEGIEKLPREEAIDLLLSINKFIRRFQLKEANNEKKRSKV